MRISAGWEAAEAQRSRGAGRGDSAFGAPLVALQRGRRQGPARQLRLGARAEARRGGAAGPGGAAPAPRPLGRGTRREGARGGAAAERRARSVPRAGRSRRARPRTDAAAPQEGAGFPGGAHGGPKGLRSPSPAGDRDVPPPTRDRLRRRRRRRRRRARPHRAECQ